jgi:hypothetical protein
MDIRALSRDTFSAIGRTPAWLGQAAHTLVGSRFFVALSGLFFVAFFAHVTSASDRFPPITKFSFASVLGFAPPIEDRPLAPDEVRTQAQNALNAGMPYAQPYIDQAKDAVVAYFSANKDAVVAGNYVGLIVSLICLITGLYLLARQELRRR